MPEQAIIGYEFLLIFLATSAAATGYDSGWFKNISQSFDIPSFKM